MGGLSIPIQQKCILHGAVILELVCGSSKHEATQLRITASFLVSAGFLSVLY